MSIQQCQPPEADVKGARPSALRPEFIRLPKPGEHCPWSGLKRTGLNELILPCEANEFNPPVKSFVLRQRGRQRGVRLISYDSLRDYILNHPAGKEVA